MIVVADTSPLNYLLLIGEIELLPRLYGQIRIPHGVYCELMQDRTPDKVRAWAGDPPVWLVIEDVQVEADFEAEWITGRGRLWP